MTSAQTCYFPDGSEATTDTPCRSPLIGDGPSACCNSGDACLDNHLCLEQSGGPMISRGSCTDETWQSPECSQYCADVGRTNGQWIYPLYVQNDKNLFCCGQAESSTNTCLSSTKGSTTPFSIEDGPVIFNRTSGSTSPNYTNIASITVTATAIVTATATTTTLSLYSKIPTSSSRREAGIGAGVGGLLGLALLVTFGLLWKQSKHKQSLRKDAQNWERKYSELMTYGAAGVGGLGYQPPHQRGGWHPDELDGRPHLPPQLEGWRPDEIDGRQVYEVATRTGAA